MKKHETVFDYIGQIFLIYGFTIICLNIFCILFGESAKEYSTIFAMGKYGLSVATMVQFFFVSVVIATLRFVFFTDGLIKKVPLAVRIASMFAIIILVMIVLIIRCGWFPVNKWQPWVMFFVCFGISAGVSTIVSVIKEKIENKKMEEALQRLKRGE